MIAPESLNLSTLPSVLLANRKQLPPILGIYFAINSLGVVQYIGQSVNIRNRWLNHHRQSELDVVGNVSIAYLEVSEPSLLSEIEWALIEYFHPPLNGLTRKPSRVKPKAELAKLSQVRVKNFNQKTSIKWKLSEVMARHRIKGSDLANRLQISNNAVSKLKNAQTMPRIDGERLNALCNALNNLAAGDAEITPAMLIEYVRNEE